MAEENKIKLRAIAPQFVVEDVVKTAEFYRDKLGFNILGYFADPPVYAMVERDGIEFHFGKPDKGSIQPNETRRSIGGDAYIWVDNIDALYNEIKAKGVEIVEALAMQSYGSRDFVVRDCNGYRITVGEV